jgi:hypothetical protein
MVLPIIGYFLIGFLEWVLAAQRTLAISQKRAILASAFVVLENLLWGLVIYSFLTEFSNILAILSYSFGGALRNIFQFKNQWQNFILKLLAANSIGQTLN